ncbi:MAG: hypothetical protein KME45_19780 [Stenomitos rutilans HA7619-LM2]|jgi:threonine/homoserine/homoserine lactone efflux protein|nr:hypothetical protein [Stenomitos rutilans HA7619-LM2]
MSHLSKRLRKQVLPGFNKAESAPAQLLLHSAALLKLSGFFINLSNPKSIKSRFLTAFQLFIRPTALTTWIGHVTMLFLSFFNKRKAHFLIPVMLAVAYSSPYLIAE